MNRRFLITALAAGLLAWGCSTEDDLTQPGPDLAGFNVQAPTTAPAGLPFAITVTAVGTDGQDPYAAFNGNVSLSVSGGSITPGTLNLTGGAGTGNVSVNVAGDITITASVAGKTGSTLLTLTAPDSIGGNPGDPVGPNIPGLRFVPSDDYAPDAGLGGLWVSTNTVALQFHAATTVAEANAVLRGAGAGIVGGVTGSGSFEGVLFLRLTTVDHAALHAAVASLDAEPTVKYVVPDALLAPLSLPTKHQNRPGGWRWDENPFGGNWGIELMRVPHMWSLNEAIEKQHQVDTYSPGNHAATTTAVLDVGFETNHPDLDYAANLTPNLEDDHGTHIAGTIAAKWTDERGIVGINPFTQLVVMGVASRGSDVFAIRPSWGDHQINGLHRLAIDHPEVSVISMSLGYTWWETGIDPATHLDAQRLVENQGRILESVMQALVIAPLVVVSAGNDAGSSMGQIEAKWNSPASYAGLELGVGNIIVVEAVGQNPGGLGGAIRWEDVENGSNVNGHISAPGEGILSTANGIWESKTGTSMATPHVAALAGYLLALDPTLSAAELKNILIASAVPVQGASPMVDAFAAALEIDVHRGNDDVLRMLCDIDDGTPDGNLRFDISSGQSIPNFDEDSDGDGGIGDGAIDMSDFRRWRDWNLIRSDDAEDMDLIEHPKNDFNHNGDYEEHFDEENLYPRGDFNGDGRIDGFGDRFFVPGRMNAELSDLEVLIRVWEDPNVPASHLEGIQKNSGDIDVWPSEFMGIPGAVTVTSSITPVGQQTPLYTHTHSGNGPGDTARRIYTVLRSDPGYVVKVQARDSQGEILDETEKIFESFKRGKDYFYDPPPNEIKVEVDFPDGVDPEAARSVRIRGGIKQGASVTWTQGLEVTLAAHGGSLGAISGLTDQDGYFTTTVTAGYHSGSVRVEAEVRDPNSVKKGVGFATGSWAAFFFGFPTDLQGWSDSTTTDGWGRVTHLSREGAGGEDGFVKLDGTGGPGEPNAWIYKELTLPAGVSKLTYFTSGHDQRNGDSNFRVRVQEGASFNTVHGWESTSGGADGVYNWVRFTDSISQFAGKTVIFYFEQDDNGPGSDEQRQFDSISIR